MQPLNQPPRPISARYHVLKVIVASMAMTAIGYAQEQPPADKTLPQPRVTVSPQTTVIDVVDDDGYPDYLMALEDQCSRGATHDNNAVRALLLTLAKDRNNEAYLPLIEEQLEIGEQDRRHEFSKYSSFVDATRDERQVAVTNQLVQQEQIAATRPWLAKEFPVMDEWLNYNAEALDAAVRAATLTHWYSPPVIVELPAVTNCPLPAASHALVLARALRLRALARIATQELDAAWKDILAIHRLALLVNKGPYLTDRYLGFRIEHEAEQPESFLLQSPVLTPLTIHRIRTDLDQLPKLPNFHTALSTGERYLRLDFIVTIARYGMNWGLDKHPLAQDLINFIFVRLVNWNTVLQDFNRHLDSAVKFSQIEDHNERRKALQQFNIELRTIYANRFGFHYWAHQNLRVPPIFRQKLTIWVSDMAASMLIPDLEPISNHLAICWTRRDVCKVGWALMAYHVDHKTFPAELKLLTPKYLPEIPLDRMTNQPLIYESDGEVFVIQSVGLNQNDDVRRIQKKQTVDDIIIRSRSSGDTLTPPVANAVRTTEQTSDARELT